ncbi:hypothetical protein LAZ67_9000983 [Cordylochernes scorpioides]|uniref:Integrase catalytic domain-containing protein n=1 Tax=Cordylochernes scorpioides TaxID=51811 RepID=A0ABY6KSS5_9ARAC|nr:hypothetical protein LAZ67_9000983 [Cordylochernes scorpioides]
MKSQEDTSVNLGGDCENDSSQTEPIQERCVKGGRKKGETKSILEERHKARLEEQERKLIEEGVRRSQRIKYRNNANLIMEIDHYIPENFKEAMDSGERNEWHKAMEDELSEIEKHKVWTLVPRENGMKVINSKWVYSTKKTPSDGIYKRKARLVAVGCNQKYGVDYKESFSPVLKKESLRTIVALATQQNLTIKTYDVKTAYIYGKCWNKKINEILYQLGIIRTKCDPCVYKLQRGEEYAILGLYVDDLIIAGTSKEINDNLASEIEKYVTLTEKKDSEPFIGIEIKREEDGFYLSQTHYIDTILHRFGLEECNSVQTPGDQNQNLDEHLDSKPVDKTVYQEMIGSLMYLSTGTRPDISFNVSNLSQYTGEKVSIIETNILLKILERCGIEYKVEETLSTKKRTRESPSDSTSRSHKTPRMEVVSQHNENDVSMNEVTEVPQETSAATPPQVNEEDIDEDGPWTKVTHAKKPRIPPVIAENVTDWKLLCQELKDLCTDKFQCTISGNKHIIKAKNISDFKKIREYVQKNNGGYSYRLQEEKPLKVVLKGVTTAYKTEDIAIELATMGFTETSVKRLHRQSTKRPMNLVLVELPKNEHNKKIYGITELLYQKIAVESFRTTNRVTQCFNCQGFGHGQLNCFLKPKCVKCAEEHHSKDCPRKSRQLPPKLPLKTEVDIDSAVGILNEKINNSYSKNTIVSSSKLIKNPKTKALIREKNKARKRWQSTWDPAHRATYLNLQGKVNQALEAEKSENWNSFLSKLESSPTDFWKKTKPIRKKTNKITSLNANGKTLLTDKEIGNDLSEHFSKHFSKAEDEVPSYLTDNTCHHPQENILSMTTPNEVKEVIKNLGNHKAPGHDNITPQMTKNLPIKWIVFLAGIFNAALHLCYFPKTWKHAIIITIPKKSPVKSPEDLRPISLLSTIDLFLLIEFVVQGIDMPDLEVTSHIFASITVGLLAPCCTYPLVDIKYTYIWLGIVLHALPGPVVSLFSMPYLLVDDNGFLDHWIRNVMSLQSTLDKGFEMKMDKKGCKPFKTTTGEVIVEGKRLPGGLYDVCGPMLEVSKGGMRYFVCFKDDFTKYRSVYFLKEKSQVIEKLEQFLLETKTTGHTVKEILTDGGKEFVNKETSKITNKYGINHRITMPYTPQQNGSAERENRTLIEAARSMIYAKNMSLKLWAEAVNTATYVLNRTGPTQIEGKTPYELWFDKKPAVDHLRIFGTECFVHVPDEKRRKLDAKSKKGILVGYCSNKDGYRIWMPNSNKVVTSRDVIFKETIPTFSLDIEKRNKELSSNQIDEQNDTQDIEKIESNVQTSDVYNLRDRSNISKPQRYIDAEINIAEGLEPKTYKEAMDSPNAQFWKEAMNEEMNSLTENDVYECTTLPPGQKPIDCKWVLKTKLNSKGEITRYKARLVAKGFAQKKGIDYEETFSPVARHDTIRTLLAIAANEDLKLVQFDIKTAFLYGDLQDQIYIKQPEGFNNGTDLVWKLKKSLYGLKQSPRCWNQKIVNFMKERCLKESTADPCLFFRKTNDHLLIIAIYVDDGIIAGTNEQEIKEFLDELMFSFKITSEPLNYFLGIEIERQPDGSIFINQKAYIKRILEKFNMSQANKVGTPTDNSTVPGEAEILENVPFREAIGSLMHLSCLTRPDITFALNKVSQKLAAPTKYDWEAVKRIFKYLVGTTEYGIM